MKICSLFASEVPRCASVFWQLEAVLFLSSRKVRGEGRWESGRDTAEECGHGFLPAASVVLAIL